MEYQQVIALLDQPDELVKQIRIHCKPIYKYESYSEYLPQLHDVMKEDVRKNRTVFEPSGDKDASGNPLKNPDGSPHTVKKLLPVIRIAIPFEKKTIAIKSAFTVGSVDLKTDAKDGEPGYEVFKAVQKVWRDQKLKFKLKTALRHRMAEMEVAFLWFKYKDDVTGETELRMNMLNPAKGFTLRPVWNSIGKLVAFGIEYTLIDANSNEIQHLDFYTDKVLMRFSNKDGVFDLTEPVTNLEYGKIPIIYDMQYQPEFHDAIALRSQFEMLISDLGEQNKRTGFPITFATGKVMGVPAGEPGKFLAGEIGSDVKMVTNDNAPASIKLEMDTIKAEMHSAVSVPDLSLESLKGLGSDISGETMKRLLTDLYIAASNEQDGNFGEFVDRNIQFLKAAVISMNPTLKAGQDVYLYAEIKSLSLDAVSDRVDVASKAAGKDVPVTSQKNAFRIAALSDDPDQDYEDYKAEQDAVVTPVI